MKSYKISEILYWIIALIASYESFSQWSINRKRLIYLLDLLSYQFLWHYLEAL